LLSASLNREKRLKAAHCSTAGVCPGVCTCGRTANSFERQWRRSAGQRGDHPKRKCADSFSRP